MVGYATYSDKRRLILLRVFLAVTAVIAGGFGIPNYRRGAILLSLVEAVVLVVCIGLIFLVRNPRRLRFGSVAYLVMLSVFGTLALALPGNYLTVFVWPLMGPLAAFFLLGKRWGIPITALFIVITLVAFLAKYGFGPNALPLVSIFNVVLFTISASAVVLFYETTRAETEAALIEDINQRTRVEAENRKLIDELRTALSEVKTLKGLLPICSNCKKIRDDEGYWNHLEIYIEKHSDAQFSHGICRECAKTIYGEEEWYRKTQEGGGEDDLGTGPVSGRTQER